MTTRKPDMAKAAIVIGGTGLVGKHLIELLIDSDDFAKVVSITRRELVYESNKVENHVVDFNDLESYSALFVGDVFFSCLGTTAKQAGSIKAQRRVDLSYQFAAAKLAHKQGVEHYLLVSSSGADSNSLSPYLKMKGELEDKVSALAFKAITIVQPSLLLGDREQARVAEGLASIVLPLVCKLPGLTKYRPIHGSAVAKKMLDSSFRQNGFARYSLDQVFPD